MGVAFMEVLLYIELSLYKNINMKLIYIKSTMEPKNYSTIRSILKKAQGEKIAPYVFKINDTQSLQDYLDKEKITYEIYQEERKIINYAYLFIVLDFCNSYSNS